MSKNIFLFSGQGSQYVGMAKELCEKYDAANAVFDTAEKVLGYDLRAVTFDGPDTELNKTVNSQPAIMACSLAAFKAAKAEGITFDGVAGHSLGEYAAMVAAGVVTMEDGFKLIKETEGYVVPVNYNSAVQTVIAGDTAACEAAAAKFAEMKKKAIKLNVASAFHSKLMQSAADEFIETAKTVEFKTANVDFYSNVLGTKLEDFSAMPDMLAKHIVSPVKFTSELAEMEKAGYENFIELGPNKVLTGLVKKTLKGKNAVNIENNATMEKALASLS